METKMVIFIAGKIQVFKSLVASKPVYDLGATKILRHSEIFAQGIYLEWQKGQN